MRWRALLLMSVAVNVALAIALVFVLRRPLGKSPVQPSGLASAASAGQVKTNVIIRRQFFSWQEVESEDYPTYIANLRDIGCPEETIRDIIVADVNQLYALKRATNVVTPGQQWWRTEPDTNVIAAAAEKLRALEEERRTLLTSLLGPNWETVEPATKVVVRQRTGIVLDGPVLGALPAEVKRAVQEIAARAQQRAQAYLDAQSKAGKPPDPAELARIQQQTRDDLAHVLAPAELEEFCLRYSQNANDLRAELNQLRLFDATPEEFRNLFRARDTFDQQIKLLYSGSDDASVEHRKALEQQREVAIKNALGPKRYAEYRLLQDPDYRQAVALAQQAGLPDSADALYEIRQATAQEQARIRADTNLTAQQKEIELRKAELEQLKANSLALGQQLPPEPPTPPAPKLRHIIEPGETIDKLSARYGVSIREILGANANLDFSKLKPGDAIYVPTSQPVQ